MMTLFVQAGGADRRCAGMIDGSGTSHWQGAVLTGYHQNGQCTPP
jgi:hypothetical protein